MIEPGLIKMKGSSYTISPERFNAIEIRLMTFDTLLQKNTIGYTVLPNGSYEIICEEKVTYDTKRPNETYMLSHYFRAPIAKNKIWWLALTSDLPFLSWRSLPQIYITGIA